MSNNNQNNQNNQNNPNQRDKNIIRLHRGMHQDNSERDQPKGSYRYALNAMMESSEGNLGVITNEESSKQFLLEKGVGVSNTNFFHNDFIVIGKCYIGNSTFCLFLYKKDRTNDKITSRITLIDKEGYVKYKNEKGIRKNVNIQDDDNVNFDTSLKFNFDPEYPISATFRKIQGGERVVYFTDGKNPPRMINFDQLNNHKKNGKYLAEKFNLIKTYSKIPEFKNFKIEEKGQLDSGSYNFAIQYLDEDLNSTEWINVSQTIYIYYDNYSDNSYEDVYGSSNTLNTYTYLKKTNKSISFEIDNLDTENYKYYRIAIISATSGSGSITNVYYSNKESITGNNVFSYGGTNTYEKGTLEDVASFKKRVFSAFHIEQIENRLVLSNIKEDRIDYEEMNKYVVNNVTIEDTFKNIKISDVIKENKKGIINKKSYQQGEVYSFGIVYVFKDGNLSPVFHIKGNYELKNAKYPDDDDMWGAQKNKKIKHFKIDEVFNYDIIYSSTYTRLLGVKIKNIFKNNNVEIPNKDKIQGCYIVRNERTDNYKTVLDTAVIKKLPFNSWDNMSVGNWYREEHDKFPQETIIPNTLSNKEYSKYVYSFLSLSHLFGDKKYNFKKIQILKKIDINKFDKNTYIKKNVRYRDFTVNNTEHMYLKMLFRRWRNIYTNYYTRVNANKTLRQRSYNVDVVRYLDSYEKTSIETTEDKNGNINRDIYNLMGDCKVGVFKAQDDITYKDDNNNDKRIDFAFVLLTREIDDVYKNFYSLPYYKEHTNIIPNDDNNNEIEIYNGDVYLSKINFASTSFYENLLKTKTEESSWIDWVVGVVSGAGAIVAGIAGQPQLTANLAKTSYTFLKSGYKKDQYNTFQFSNISLRNNLSNLLTGFTLYKPRITNPGKQLYHGGVDTSDTSLGGFLTIFGGSGSSRQSRWWDLLDRVPLLFTYVNLNHFYNHTTISWFMSIAENLYFISPINANLRLRMYNSEDEGFFTKYVTDSITLNYMQHKLTQIEPSYRNGIKYSGFAQAEYYEINKDFQRVNKEKIFHHLDIFKNRNNKFEHKFPNRIIWSQQSFREEQTDNYRVFLHNNYKDIQSEYGDITNIFTLNNNLYIHTENALYLLPKNLQERITGQIITYIGTGEFFNIPPKMIGNVDNIGNGGCIDKSSLLKTKYGVFFVSQPDKKVYLFNGNQLIPISDKGMSIWFRNNITYKNKRLTYDSKINHFNTYKGALNGFIMEYDYKFDRILLSKINTFIGDEVADTRLNNYSWTISFSMKFKTWISFHSYVPLFYLSCNDYLLGLYFNNNNNDTGNKRDQLYFINVVMSVYQHNNLGKYSQLVDDKASLSYTDFIIDFISLNNPLVSKIWNSVSLQTSVKRYEDDFDFFKELKNQTFTDVIFYNSSQCSTKNQITESPTKKYDIKAQKIDKFFVLNKIRNYLKKDKIPFKRKRNFIDKELILDNFEIDKTDSSGNVTTGNPDLKVFQDVFLGIRLYFKSENKDRELEKIMFYYSLDN